MFSHFGVLRAFGCGAAEGEDRPLPRHSPSPPPGSGMVWVGVRAARGGLGRPIGGRCRRAGAGGRGPGPRSGRCERAEGPRRGVASRSAGFAPRELRYAGRLPPETRRVPLPRRAAGLPTLRPAGEAKVGSEGATWLRFVPRFLQGVGCALPSARVWLGGGFSVLASAQGMPEGKYLLPLGRPLDQPPRWSWRSPRGMAVQRARVLSVSL